MDHDGNRFLSFKQLRINQLVSVCIMVGRTGKGLISSCQSLLDGLAWTRGEFSVLSETSVAHLRRVLNLTLCFLTSFPLNFSLFLVNLCQSVESFHFFLRSFDKNENATIISDLLFLHILPRTVFCLCLFLNSFSVFTFQLLSCHLMKLPYEMETFVIPVLAFNYTLTKHIF